MTERQWRSEAVEAFVCPICNAHPGRACRRKSTDWTGKRPLWKRVATHRERVEIAYRRAIQATERDTP